MISGMIFFSRIKFVHIKYFKRFNDFAIADDTGSTLPCPTGENDITVRNNSLLF